MPENFWTAFWMYIFFVPNLAFSMFVAIPNIGQAWSIGVEEQFYAIWPWLQKKFKNPLRTMLWFMAVMIGIKALFLLCVLGIDASWVLKVKKFLVMLKLECMALGGIGAYLLYFNKTNILRLVYHPVVEILAYASIPGLVYLTPMKVQNAVHLAYSISFLIIILNVASNPRALIKFRWGVLDYLGKISFGIYMYHMMCIVLTVHLVPGLMHAQSRDLKGIENLAIYSIAFALTILVSAISYHFLELPFIRMKKKVTTVISGDNAAN
jgi:peptidoglycan/LPS O-acetylase OafA/YrhL